MPLRFRSVVPYTLPGVLALIGWWWYISRKKERHMGGECLEGAASAPPTVGLRTPSPAEGSNGLIGKGSVSPCDDPQSPAHRPTEVSTRRIDAQAPPSPERGGETVLRAEDASRTSLGAAGPGGEEGLQTEPRPQTDHTAQEVQPTQFTKGTSSAPSGVQRPEPEGEVAKHQGTTGPEDEICVVPAPGAESVATPTSAQELKNHIGTSTPTSPAPVQIQTSTVQVPAQDPPPSLPVPDDKANGDSEEPDLELLAAGLITEVISAATKEVLGVTDGTRLRSQQDRPLTGPSHMRCEAREVLETVEEEAAKAVPNGCSSSTPAWAPGSSQKGPWSAHQAAQSAPLLSVRLKGDEAAAAAEDSACSTCHSEDGVSSEDLQNSTDVIQVTDLSAGDATRPQAEADSSTDAAVLALSEEDSVDAVCDLKRLNGMGLRNGVHGTCDLETDQSGGSDVNSMDSVDSGCTMGGGGESQTNHHASSSSSSELIIWEVEVPKHLVGRLIGKQGRYVSFLKQNSGAKIYISTLPYTQEFQICHIEGTQQQVDKALALIGKKFKDLDLTNLYAPPAPPLTLPSLPMTSWLLLPSGVTVEVIVVNIVSAGHVFVQQHTHPTYHALRSLDQQMFLCYSQPGTPALPSPAEVGVICAAPAVEGSWWRAQVITFYKETSEVEIRYVDYGGYDRVKIDSLRQIRSDFVTLPFQGAEVLLDNIAPLPGEDRFSAEATSALEEMTRGVALLAQVSNYDNNTGLPLVHLWNMVGDEVISVNRTLAERGLGVWVDSF
ncbi:A kinase (PRKA) anchor protein 1b [Sphaeramia orbicularis]|uniref:A kinase (PRKA) anchor protein 1b n=1 Tax=Sphaeramia orbicularis TaxID=375764 RepID=UPI00117E415E|nr:A-kinase anchor protein 1, mitochondrial [Sphaeramia orbicularis]